MLHAVEKPSLCRKGKIRNVAEATRRKCTRTDEFRIGPFK